MAKKPVKKSVKSKKPAKAAHKPAAKKAHAAKATPAKKAAHKPAAAAHKPAAKKAAPAAAKKAHAAKPAAHKSAAHKPAAAKKPAAVHHQPKPAPAKKAHEKDKEKEKHAKPAPALKAPHPAPAEKPAKKKAKQAPEEEVEVPEEAEGEGEEEESEEVVLTDAEGRRYCRVKDCDQLSTVEGYCRYHYLLFWKKIQVRKKILTEGKLERYIEELTARYPDKFLDMLRKDLRSDKEFLAAIAELEIDESATENEFEDEAQTYIDEVRGMAETPARDDEDF